MRPALFLGTCFLSVILLTLIPYKTTEVNGVFTHPEGMLPSLLNFSIICIVILLVAATITLFKFKKNFQGQLILKRIDFNFSKQFSIVVFWVIFILTSQFLSKDFFYVISRPKLYFLVILVSFSLYLIFEKWYTRKAKPDYLSIDGDSIYLKSFFGKGKRKLNNIKAFNYDTKNNAIELQFEEGLENIKLYLTDYKLKELQNLLETINFARKGSIKFNENLDIFFNKIK